MRCTLVILALLASTCRADEPFVGTWVQDVAKSRSSPENVRTLETDGKSITITSVLGNGDRYILDGLPRPTQNGGAVHINRLDGSHTFVRRFERDGKPISETRWEASADGKTLNTITTYYGLTGARTESHVFDRVSGTTGLNGTWRPRETVEAKPETIVIGLSEEGLVVTRGWGRSWLVDGKPRVAAAGESVTVRKNGPNVIERITSKAESITYRTHLELSSDGKTITQTDNFTSGNGTPIKWIGVYRKQ